MANKKVQTKQTKTSKSRVKKVDFEPMKVTVGVATLAALTLFVFAFILVIQML